MRASHLSMLGLRGEMTQARGNADTVGMGFWFPKSCIAFKKVYQLTDIIPTLPQPFFQFSICIEVTA